MPQQRRRKVAPKQAAEGGREQEEKGVASGLKFRIKELKFGDV
jgi:hypothetical protein